MRGVIATTVSPGWVIKQGVRALGHPFQVRRSIALDIRLPYGVLLPLMMVLGLAGPLLHYRAVNRIWLTQLQPADATYALLAFALAPLAWCGVTSAGLYATAALLRRPVSPGWCDLAAFHLGMAWGGSILFDLLHVLFGVPMQPIRILGYPTLLMHAGWFFGFPMLVVQLVACWQVLAGSGWRQLFLGMLFALGCLAIMRLLLRPLPEFVTLYALGQGLPRPNYWMLTLLLAGLGCLATLLSRLGMAWHHPRGEASLHAA